MALNKYRSVDDVKYGTSGPCLLPGHPQEHVLEARCLNAMSGFFYNDGKFGKSFPDFINAVKRK